MQMGHGLTGMRPVVDHEPIAVGEIELLRDIASREEQVPEHRLIVRDCLADARYRLLRDDQQMGRRLWLDIVDHEAKLVLVFDLGRDFA